MTTRISTIARLSLGLVLLTASILFCADAIGLIPDPSKAIVEERRKISELMAIYCAVAAEKNDARTIMTAAIQGLMKRNDDVLSAAVRKVDGTVLVEGGDHQTHWKGASDKGSTSTHVQVPILQGDTLWGRLEIRFKSFEATGIRWLLGNAFFKLMLFVLLMGSITYRLFMKRALRYLDPSAVVPSRVKAALDSLSEGVVLIDQNEHIVVANTAFGERTGQSISSLIGAKLSDMNWTIPKSGERVRDLPWSEALRERGVRMGIRLGLPVGSDRRKTFVVNATPIVDGDGPPRGVLATFDDVTQVEAQNDKLRDMVKALEISRQEIRLQNKKLKFLATRDSLTNCLNRRALFETMELEFYAAKRYGHDLACIMLDIDHFKSINDNHGHATGDQVLRGVARVIQSLLRKSDVVGRYGGEEFCVLLSHGDLRGAVEAAERFRLEIASHDFSGVRVTASFGASSRTLGANDLSELVGQADNALYAAKEGGRNRVVRWDELKRITDRSVTPACNVTNEDGPGTSPRGAGALAGDHEDGVSPLTAAALKNAAGVKYAGCSPSLDPEFGKCYVDGETPACSETDVDDVQTERFLLKSLERLMADDAAEPEPAYAAVTDSEPTVRAGAVGGTDSDQRCVDEGKDALRFVRDCLAETCRMSECVGRHADLADKAQPAVQVNHHGGWGDGGELEEKDRLDSGSISRAAHVLKA